MSKSYKEVLERIVSRLEGHPLPLPIHAPLRFVDRVREARAVLDESEKVVLNGMITVLYGPKGCGKTSLFKVLYEVVTSMEDADVDVVIVGSEREAWKAEKLYVPRSLDEILKEVKGILGFDITLTGEVTSSLAIDATKIISLMVGYIARMFRDGRKVIIVLDEVKADSGERLAEFRGWLEGFANTLLWDAGKYWVEKGGSISVVALTSDAMVKEIRNRVGSKVNWALMWNLPYNAMVELSKQLELDVEPQILWRLTGGNPRALVNIKVAGLKEWVKSDVIRRLVDALEDASTSIPGDKLWVEVERAVDNIDVAHIHLKTAMLKHNVAVYVAGGMPISELPREDWVREYYAYQMPAFYHALRVVLARRSPYVTPDDVIGEAERS
ncbi:MAG: ATP-binding protein [Desulfurococcaceae archaeon]|nr:ATP-binding protein [Desulfurococcaceae archaeon]